MGEVLRDSAKDLPFVGKTGDRIDILLVKHRPTLGVILKAPDYLQWMDELERASDRQLSLELPRNGSWRKEYTELLVQIFHEYTVVGLSLSGWSSSCLTPHLTSLLEILTGSSLRTLNLASCLDHGDLSYLKEALPATLEELDLSHCWPTESFRAISTLPRFAFQLKGILHGLPNLRTQTLWNECSCSRGGCSR